MISETSWAPLFKSEAWLRQRYIDEKLSTRQIAALAGAARSTIAKRLRAFGIPLRTEDEAHSLRKGQVGYGKKLVRGQEVEHQREVEVIRRIRELRDQGLSYHRIASVLNTMKVPTKTRGARWHATTVMNLVKDLAVVPPRDMVTEVAATKKDEPSDDADDGQTAKSIMP